MALLVHYWNNKSSAAQAENFHGRGGFVESGDFDKLFFKKIRRKGATGKNLELFHPDTPKTAFWIEDATQEWTQLGQFFGF